MKSTAKLILQKLLGFKTYLLVFAVFVIIKLRWDKKEKDFMKFLGLIPDGGLILDIGANIGATTFHLSKRFPASRVFSFEPVKINSDTLKTVVKLFSLKNVRVFEMALGNRSGSAEMVMPVIGKVKFHGLAHVVQDKAAKNPGGIKYKVPMAQLDDIAELKNPGIPVSAIKMDVENFEYHVLRGGKNLIEKNRPIIYCELWDNENRKNCINFLASSGYRPFIFQGKKLIPCTDMRINKNNFLFLTENEAD